MTWNSFGFRPQRPPERATPSRLPLLSFALRPAAIAARAADRHNVHGGAWRFLRWPWTQSLAEGNCGAAAFLACSVCSGETSRVCSTSARIPRAAAFAADRVVIHGIL